jgi:hypothetical protein
MSRIQRRKDDRGATLVIALILVTTIAFAMGAILSLVDTNVRTTVGLRDQSATAYAGDGAAQAAINQLRQGIYPNNCTVPSGSPLSLGSASQPFYSTNSSSATPLNAYVSCAPDTGTGTGFIIGPSNKPADALLTVGVRTDEEGQDYSFGAANKVVCVEDGNVRSKSTIKTGADTLGARVGGTGLSTDCRTGSGTGLAVQAVKTPLSTGCNGTFAPTPCTLTSSFTVPTYPLPPAPSGTTQPPVCSADNKYAAFRPGVYTNVALLNSPCGVSYTITPNVEWFSPGIYYFDFGSTAWSPPALVVGGTPMNSATPSIPIAGLDPANGATLAALAQVHSSPGACANPKDQNVQGVEFVFGGRSIVNLNSGGDFEICASYQSASPPVALYGLPSPVGSVSAQSGCLVDPSAVGCNSTNTSIFYTDPNGHPELHIDGFIYAPNARIALTLKNSNGQVFNWGLILRSFALSVVGSSPTTPFIQLPKDTTVTTITYSLMYLSVWLCPASAGTCAPSGNPRLQAKVQITGTPPVLKVLSWSEQR